ncbi:hypothetical protein CAC42_3212 [Sphaceloma murrayae]|uniref:Presequence translocated-associated motor subunit PAM17 n=1 Tax=Sphaceloma murrayae TaxID=2082308 RepID=A0A2K1QRV5_9PEZI|nr:hypothetical protein CAC42_3212 [Sphaceloma murrayae]
MSIHTTTKLFTPSSTQHSGLPAQHLVRPHAPRQWIGGSSTAWFSTTSARQDTSSASAPSPSGAASSDLTWNDFLKMRRKRRYVNLATSVGTAVGSIGVTVPLALQYEVDNQIASITGLDPFIALGLTITAVGGAGWLLGPFVGNAAFLLRNRRTKDAIAKKERDFYDHIKRFRADPTSSSVNNPVPDYYGEKIGSVADYRRWLKDQRAFNRKKNKNLL